MQRILGARFSSRGGESLGGASPETTVYFKGDGMSLLQRRRNESSNQDPFGYPRLVDSPVEPRKN